MCEVTKMLMEFQHLWNQQMTFIVVEDEVAFAQLFIFIHLIAHAIDNFLFLFMIPFHGSADPQRFRSAYSNEEIKFTLASAFKDQGGLF